MTNETKRSAIISRVDYKHAQTHDYMQPVIHPGNGIVGRIQYVYVPPGCFIPVESNSREIYGIVREGQRTVDDDGEMIKLVWVA